MPKDINTLAEALEALEERDSTIASLTADLTAAEAKAEKAEADLTAANDLLTETQAKVTEAEAKAASAEARATAAETESKEFALACANAGVKPDAEGKVNAKALMAHCKTIASAEAMQIVAAQGADAPLPICGEQPGTEANAEEKPNTPLARIAQSVRIS